MVLREHNDPLNQSRGIMGPLGNAAVQNNRGRLRQRFDLIRKLGQGTYGKVQLGIDKETGQEVAIKTIKKSKIETEADLIRIRREIQIMSSVRHPNIIHIYEVFENREKMVLVMEYAAGGELYDYLNDRKILQEDEARRIFRQIASAAYYCHKHKICHRDLKLENILLDEGSNAKIADFGLSNVFDDVNLLKTFCGSPLYASPEIVRGTPYFGPEVDCWSLGVLLYTLVYGAMPFDGSNFKRLVKQISNGDYYEPKKPAEASHLIRTMLTVDPIKRASIKDVCAHQWINQGFDKPCLATAEELANQTPVRLDVLLSVAPGYSINHSQVVIPHDGNDESEAGAAGGASNEAAGPSSLSLAGPSQASASEPKKAKKDKETPQVPGTSKPTVAPFEKPARASLNKEHVKGAPSVNKEVKRKAAVKKKSKSSPVLELIVDEEEEMDREPLEVIDGGVEEDDDAGDTLSEISEIQTIAEDIKDMAKSKSKLKVEQKIEEVREEPASKPEKKEKTVVAPSAVATAASPSTKESRQMLKTEVEPAPKPAETKESTKATPAVPQAPEKPERDISKVKKLEKDVKKAEKDVPAEKPSINKELGKKEEKETPKEAKEKEQQPKEKKLDKEDTPKVKKPEKDSAEEKKSQKDVTTEKKPEKEIPAEKKEKEDQPTAELAAATTTAEPKETKSPEPATKPPTVVKKKLVKKASVDKTDDEKNKSSTKSSITSSATGSSSSLASSAGGKSATKLDKESKSESGPKPKLRPRSDSNSSDASPTRIERRNSKVISQKTAELIQNLETKQSLSSGDKPKKLFFPSLKVSDAKRAFDKPPKPVKEPTSPPVKKAEEKPKAELKKAEKPEGSELTVEKPKKSKSKSPSPIPDEAKPSKSKVEKAESTKEATAGPDTKVSKPKEPAQEKPATVSPVKAAETPKEAKEPEKPANLAPTEPAKQKSVSPKPQKKILTKGPSVSKENEPTPMTSHPTAMPRSPEPPSEMTDSLNTEIDVTLSEAPKKISQKPQLTKLKIPPPTPSPVPNPEQLVKPVLVDNGTGPPKQAVMLISGRTTPSADLDTSMSTDPFFSQAESISVSLPAEKVKPATPAKPQNKEQAAKKISSVISRIASSESAERIMNEGKKGKKIVKTEVSFPVAAAPSTERIIPIKFEDDVVPSASSTPPTPATPLPHHVLPQSNKTQSAPNISRIPPRKSVDVSSSNLFSRQNSSDTESSIAPPPKPEPIRKSPREFIIPIKLETSGQTVLPKEDVSEASHSEDPFRMDSRLRSGRFGRHKRYNSLLSDSSLDEEPTAPASSASASTSRRSSSTATAPSHARSHSQGDEPDTPTTPLGTFRKYRMRRTGGLPLDRSDSFSSAEEDEEDAFEVLTAESLFSSLLDRVRNLTKRINRDDGPNPGWQGPESPGFMFGTANPFRDFMARAPSETRSYTSTGPAGSYTMTRSFSREPSVTVTVSTGPSWRRSLSREMSGDSDSASAFSEPQSASHNLPSRSGSIFPSRGSSSFSGADHLDNCTVRSLPMNLGSTRRTPFLSQRSEPHGVSEHHHHHHHATSTASPLTSTYTPPTARPYGRTLSNAEYNTSVTLPFRRSLKSYDRPSYGQSDYGDSYSSTAAPSSIPGSSSALSSSYNAPHRSNSVMNRYTGSASNSFSSSGAGGVGGGGGLSSSDPPYSRFSRSLSRARATPDQDIQRFSRDASASRHLDSSHPLHNSNSYRHSGESNGWVGGSNSSSVRTAAASTATMTTQEKMNNYQNFYKGLSQNPLRSFPESTSPTPPFLETPSDDDNFSSPNSAFSRPSPSSSFLHENSFIDNSHLLTNSNCSEGPPKVLRPVKPISPNRSFTTRELSSPPVLVNKNPDNPPSNIPKWPSISVKTHRPVNLTEANVKAAAAAAAAQAEGNNNNNSPLRLNTTTKTLPSVMSPVVTSSPSLATPVTPNQNIAVALMRPQNPTTFRVVSPPPMNSPTSPTTQASPSQQQQQQTTTELPKTSPGTTSSTGGGGVYPKIPRRDTRATSVEKITRLLERKSMPRERVVSPPPRPLSPPSSNTLPPESYQNSENNNNNNLSPSSTLTLKSEDENTTDRSSNASPEKFKNISNSNSLQRIAKPKFIQSLEKKWEKLTTPSSSVDKSKEEVGMAAAPTTGPTTVLTTVPQQQKQQQQPDDSDESEARAKPDSESMLLQRAVSPEKKLKSKFGSSTVNYMLGKFKKFEETSIGSKIPAGKPPVGSLSNTKIGRRVQSVYAGACSDSVLALPRDTTPSRSGLTNGTTAADTSDIRTTPKSRLSPRLEKSGASSSSISNGTSQTLIGSNKVEQETESRESLVRRPLSLGIFSGGSSNSSSSNVPLHSTSNNPSQIPRLNTKASTPQPQYSHTSSSTLPSEPPAPVVAATKSPVKSPLTETPTHLPFTEAPQINIIPDARISDDPDDNLLTPTSISDSFDSSSACSEKTEMSLRSSVLEDEESVSDRIFRKSFYPRFNSLDRKKSKSAPSSNPRQFKAKSQTPGHARSSVSPSSHNNNNHHHHHNYEVNPSSLINSTSSPLSPIVSPDITQHLITPAITPTPSNTPSPTTVGNSSKINKYNPNPLFKELITDDFKSEVGTKAEYSRRVTSKLSKLLREIESDIGSTGGGGAGAAPPNNKDSNNLKNSLSTGTTTALNGKSRKSLSPSPGRLIDTTAEANDSNHTTINKFRSKSFKHPKNDSFRGPENGQS